MCRKSLRNCLCLNILLSSVANFVVINIKVALLLVKCWNDNPPEKNKNKTVVYFPDIYARNTKNHRWEWIPIQRFLQGIIASQNLTSYWSPPATPPKNVFRKENKTKQLENSPSHVFACVCDCSVNPLPTACLCLV